MPKSLYLQSAEKLASLPADSPEATALRKLREEAWETIKPHTLEEIGNGGWSHISMFNRMSEELAAETSNILSGMQPEEQKRAQTTIASLVQSLEQGKNITELSSQPDVWKWQVELAKNTHATNEVGRIADNYLAKAEGKALSLPDNLEVNIHLDQAAKGDFKEIVKRYSPTALAEAREIHVANGSEQIHEAPLKTHEPGVQSAARELPKAPVTETPHAPTAGHAAADAERTVGKDIAQEAGHAAEKGMWKTFAEMHWGKKTAIIGGTAAAVGAVGYWALKEDKKEEKMPAQEAKR